MFLPHPEFCESIQIKLPVHVTCRQWISYLKKVIMHVFSSRFQVQFFAFGDFRLLHSPFRMTVSKQEKSSFCGSCCCC